MRQLAHRSRQGAALSAAVATGNTGADGVVSPVDSEGAAGPANRKTKDAIVAFFRWRESGPCRL